jgi:hypothetical protein
VTANARFRGRVECTTSGVATANDVKAKLAALKECDGWVLYTDGWTWRAGTRSGSSLGEDRPVGHPLAAELTVDQRTSVQLRRHLDGWQWTQIIETACEPIASGDDDLEVDERDRAFDRTFISTVEAGPMAYRIWWRRDRDGQEPVRPFAPLVARFLGWEK